MLKKRFMLLVVLILLFEVLPVSAGASSVYAPYDGKLWVDDQLVEITPGYLTQDGSMLVPVQVVEMLGASFQWFPEEWMIRISTADRRLTMYINNYQCANGEKVEKMSAYPIIFQETVMIPLRYVAESLGASVFWYGQEVIVSTTGAPPARYNNLQSGIQQTKPETGLIMGKTIVLDPGHGGSDPGAVAGGINEKDLNLQVSKILKDMLSEAGLTVYMTRSEDKYVGLYTRASIANDLNADLFISIHHNASTNSGAHGVMTLYYPTSKEQKMNGRKLAEIVQKNLVDTLKEKDWGIIPRPNLVVTRETRMPAILAELGFMTNKAELGKLVTYEYQKQAAQALYKSIIEALQQ